MYQIVTIYYEYMFKKKVFHRDIKPANIFLNKLKNGKYEFKIGDFGLVKSSEAEKNTFCIGTPRSVAPEQGPFGDGNYTSKTDIYPMGFIFFELLMGKYPDDIKSKEDVSIKQKLSRKNISN